MLLFCLGIETSMWLSMRWGCSATYASHQRIWCPFVLCKSGLVRSPSPRPVPFITNIASLLPLINGVTRQIGCPFTSIVGGNHSVWLRCACTAAHAVVSNATQEVKNVGSCTQFSQLWETAEETLETHGFSTQVLSGNCPHISIASAHECLEMDPVVDGTANLRTIECPQAGQCVHLQRRGHPILLDRCNVHANRHH